jgi:hypothetical protein
MRSGHNQASCFHALFDGKYAEILPKKQPAGLNVCGGYGLAPSIMRTTKMLAAWTSIASESVRGWF